MINIKNINLIGIKKNMGEIINEIDYLGHQ